MGGPTHDTVAALGIVLAALPGAAPQRLPADLAGILARVGERVERYFERAQSIVCLETVNIQPLGSNLGAASLGRTIESELWLTWDPLSADGEVLEAQTRRDVLQVNGHRPRPNDPYNCTGPEQQATETQPLSMLLPGQQSRYTFSLAKPDRIDGRPAIVLDYRHRKRASVSVSEVEGNPNCVSFDLDGGLRGRVWIDPQTYDVLRLDQHLGGMVDIPLPRATVRRTPWRAYWTLERWDVSVRFRPVAFEDPLETLVLPVSVSSLRITRGAGTPTLRTMTTYTQYRRFLTGGRIVKDWPKD